MPKIVKLHVEKGKMIQVDDKTWSKSAYRLEADVSDVTNKDGLEKTRLDLAFTIDDWLQQEQHTPENLDAATVDTSKIPNLDLAELNACPWQTYSKQPAKPGQVAWIKNPEKFERFDAPPVLQELAKALRTIDGKELVLGDMSYELSGKDDMKDSFIKRAPVKGEKAR